MKKKAFTLIELLVVISIIAMLISIAISVISGPKGEIEKQKNAVIVNIENDTATVQKGILNKIELKPAFSGVNFQIYLTEMPEEAHVAIEDNKHYLLWTPKDDVQTVRTTIITSGENLKEEQEVTFYAK